MGNEKGEVRKEKWEMSYSGVWGASAELCQGC